MGCVHSSAHIILVGFQRDMHKGLFGKSISVSVALHIFEIQVGFLYSYRRLRLAHMPSHVTARVCAPHTVAPVCFRFVLCPHPALSMVRLRLSTQSCPSANTERNNSTCRRHAIIATTIATVAATVAVIDASWNRLNPEPYHTSALSGRAWVQELLNGHRDRMKDNLALRPIVFQRLEKELIIRGGLRHRQHVDTTEQLAIFLFQIVTNNSICTTGERFQRSNETISRCIYLTIHHD